MDLFAERGWDGLTIAEVCRRAEVSAPSIYARVDGKAGLFRAAHERWLRDMEESEATIATRLEQEELDGADRAAHLMAELYDANASVLRAVIDRSVHDDELRARGAAASRALVARVADILPLEGSRAAETSEALYAACVLRVLVGDDFLRASGEELDAFVARLRRMVG